MHLQSVTVGIPVRDLALAESWYRSAFDLGAPDLRPVEGVIEWDLGPVWLQLLLDPVHAGVQGMSVTFSVADAAAERARFAGLGLAVSELRRFEGAVEFFALTDLDGNELGFVTELT